jgi:predicted amidohydrolase
MAKVAVVQLHSSNDLADNMGRVRRFIGEAAAEGAALVAFPENCLYLGRADSGARPHLDLEGAEIGELQALATAGQIEVLLGSVPEAGLSAEPQHPQKVVYNTAVLLYPQSPGRLETPEPRTYRKIHLFDVSLPNRETFEESRFTAAGQEVVVAASRIGKLGLSVCYDLRFPELYRRLVDYGAEVLAIPSAFTYETGKEHWHTLVKARAIENLAYVLAPAQVGWGEGERRCFGHSMIIDPWGGIMAELAEEGEGMLLAEINLDFQRHIRLMFPALKHRKLFTSSG